MQCGHLVAESERRSRQAWWNIKRCIAPHGGCTSQASCRHIRHCCCSSSVSICILSDLTKRNSLYIVLRVHHVSSVLAGFSEAWLELELFAFQWPFSSLARIKLEMGCPSTAVCVVLGIGVSTSVFLFLYVCCRLLFPLPVSSGPPRNT